MELEAAWLSSLRASAPALSNAVGTGANGRRYVDPRAKHGGHPGRLGPFPMASRRGAAALQRLARFDELLRLRTSMAATGPAGQRPGAAPWAGAGGDMARRRDGMLGGVGLGDAPADA